MELKRDPTVNEIAADIGVESEDVIVALEAVQSPSSIHDTLYQEDSDPIYVLDQLCVDKENTPAWFENIALKEVLDKLPAREKRCFALTVL